MCIAYVAAYSLCSRPDILNPIACRHGSIKENTNSILWENDPRSKTVTENGCISVVIGCSYPIYGVTNLPELHQVTEMYFDFYGLSFIWDMC